MTPRGSPRDEHPTATKTFRARSLTDALAQVRDELGPDAVVVRRREGLEGGVAGFFQKAVVEIEAQPGGAALLTRRRPRDVAARRRRRDRARADGGPRSRSLPRWPATPRPPASPPPWRPPSARPSPPSAERRRRVPRPPRAPRRCARTPTRPWTPSRTRATPRPRSCRSSPCPRPPPPFVPEPVAAPAPAIGTALAAPPDHAEADRVAATLRRAGLSEAFSAAVLDEATVHGLPFTDEGHTALRPLVARALARRLTVAPVSGARAVAVVGAGGSGKTAVIARLAVAYAAARRLPVAVIALRSKDSGAELARLLAPAGVPMWATDDVEGAAARIANLRRGALVLVDTHGAARADEDRSLRRRRPRRRPAPPGPRRGPLRPSRHAGRRGRARDARRRPRPRRRPHRRHPQRRHRPPGHARRAGRRGGPADLLPGRQRHGAPRRRRGPGLRPAP